MNKTIIGILFVLTNLTVYISALKIFEDKSEGQSIIPIDRPNENTNNEDKQSIISVNRSNAIHKNSFLEVKQIMSSKDYGSKNKFSSLANIQKNLEKMSEDELKDLMDSFEESLYFDDTHKQLKNLILLAWEKLNPASLLSYINNSIEFKNFKGQVLARWSEKEPLKVLEWLRENNPIESMDLYLVGGYASEAYSKLFEVDKEKAFAQLSQEKAKLLSQLLLFHAVNKLSSSEDFKRVIELSKGKAPLDYLIYGVVGPWAKVSPEEAINWVDNLTDEKHKKTAMSQVTSSWLKEEPMNAANWILENNGSSASSLQRISTYWPAEDKKGLLNWITKLPDSTTKNAALGDTMMLGIAQKNIDSSLYNSALKKISSEELKMDVVSNTYIWISENDGKKAATDFINKIQIDESSREHILNIPQTQKSTWFYDSYLKKEANESKSSK